jgi:hypothetical protein
MPDLTNSNILSRAFDWINARADHEDILASRSRIDLRTLSTDLGVSETEFRQVVQDATDHAVLMERMMSARGLDPDAVGQSFGGCLREMATMCAGCCVSHACRHELDAGTAAVNAHNFCVNAMLMNLLRWRMKSSVF